MEAAHEDALKRLLAAYDSGRLVPFLGAGMSRPACPDWKEFVRALERQARKATPSFEPLTGRDRDAFLIERAQRALLALRRLTSDLTSDAIGAALAGRQRNAPPQTEQLARLHWPLVISTNYDDFFLASSARWREQARRRRPGDPDRETRRRFGSRYRVAGRSPEHCQQVLTSLREPAEPLLWAIHGYIGGQARWVDDQRPGPLPERELIVGHAEYRRVMHAENHFRRAFAEVFRSRSLLFLGCGLSDSHLLGLFEEVLALTGPSPMPHYAVLFQEDRSDQLAWSLRSRFNITPIQLRKHGSLVAFLGALADRAPRRRARASGWAFRWSDPARGADREPDLEIVRGPLPGELREGECIVVSAGVEDGARLWLSHPIRKALEPVLKARAADIQDRLVPAPPRDGYVARIGRTPVLLAVARDRSSAVLDTKDARRIAHAMKAALAAAVTKRFHVAHFQVLAASSSSPYPPRTALAHMLRGYAAWRAEGGRGLAVRIHVVDEELLSELAGGRVDPLELADASHVRYWLEIQDADGRIERELRYAMLDTRVRDVCEEAFSTSDAWQLSVEPPPRYDELSRPARTCLELTLEELGVVHGSTVRFSRS